MTCSSEDVYSNMSSSISGHLTRLTQNCQDSRHGSMAMKELRKSVENLQIFTENGLQMFKALREDATEIRRDTKLHQARQALAPSSPMLFPLRLILVTEVLAFKASARAWLQGHKIHGRHLQQRKCPPLWRLRQACFRPSATTDPNLPKYDDAIFGCTIFGYIWKVLTADLTLAACAVWKE